MQDRTRIPGPMRPEDEAKFTPEDIARWWEEYDKHESERADQRLREKMAANDRRLAELQTEDKLLNILMGIFIVFAGTITLWLLLGSFVLLGSIVAQLLK